MSGQAEEQPAKPGRIRLEAVMERDEEKDNVERHETVGAAGRNQDKMTENDEDEEEHEIIIRCLVFLSGVDLESPRLDRQV